MVRRARRSRAPSKSSSTGASSPAAAPLGRARAVSGWIPRASRRSWSSSLVRRNSSQVSWVKNMAQTSDSVVPL